MAAKLLLHSMADENHPDLQKQIGRMTAIFQMFDHQHILSARQIAQKRQLPSSSSSFDASQLKNIGFERDFNRIHHQQAASTESSRAALSSSSSSSLFSFDSSPYLTQQSMDLKDVFGGRRLSYESQDTTKSSLSKENQNHLVNNFPSGNFNDKLQNVGESQIRPPGVVAKLMGLEALPDSASSSNNPHLEEEDSFTKPLKRKEPKLPIREDFRALEQILEAIQSNRVLKTRNQEQVLKFAAPIVIMKPAKLVERQGLHSSSLVVALGPLFNLQKFHGNSNDSNGASNRRTTKSHSPRKNRSRKSIAHPSPEPQQLPKQTSSSNSVKNSRIQQKKLELEKCLKPPPTPLNSSNPKRQSKSNSPSGKSRSKLPDYSNPSEVSGEFTSYRKPIEKSNPQLEPLSELASGDAEHPSPVSVLDVPEYTDEELSPAKQEPISLKENWDRSSEINHRKLQNIDHLVQKLKNLNSDHDEESTDYIATLCENRTNPDHRYISEILLTSGLLLRDLNSMPFQLHPSGHPINPELFYVLEQTKTCSKPKKEKLQSQRRLIFDTVNEILVKKLTFAGVIAEPHVRPKKVATKSALTARKLLKELCFEIDQLEAKQNQHQKLNGIAEEGVMNMSESWNDFHVEVCGTVLDIERLIFKDLVSEVLIF